MNNLTPRKIISITLFIVIAILIIDGILWWKLPKTMQRITQGITGQPAPLSQSVQSFTIQLEEVGRSSDQASQQMVQKIQTLKQLLQQKDISESEISLSAVIVSEIPLTREPKLYQATASAQVKVPNNFNYIDLSDSLYTKDFTKITNLTYY